MVYVIIIILVLLACVYFLILHVKKNQQDFYYRVIYILVSQKMCSRKPRAFKNAQCAKVIFSKKYFKNLLI